jgi:hypothetical protein
MGMMKLENVEGIKACVNIIHEDGVDDHNKWDGANEYSSTYSMRYTLVPGLRLDTIWIQRSIGSCQTMLFSFFQLNCAGIV